MLNPQRSLSELPKMSAASQVERAVLEEEFNWLLKEEVHSVLKQLQDVLKVKVKLSCKHCGNGWEKWLRSHLQH